MWGHSTRDAPGKEIKFCRLNRPNPWRRSADTPSLSTPSVDALIMFRSDQMRLPVETVGGIVCALRPLRLRYTILDSCRVCVGAPASTSCALLAERSPPWTGSGIPLALVGAEETRSRARAPRLYAMRTEHPHGRAYCPAGVHPRSTPLAGALAARPAVGRRVSRGAVDA
jgi:hypothetical protein